MRLVRFLNKLSLDIDKTRLTEDMQLAKRILRSIHSFKIKTE